ncbi:MAG: EAL domain-containing protein [Deltaproteobacteria bacterium]|nr:EAL domain-containing protein [Deltaproteobacteria bacterium]
MKILAAAAAPELVERLRAALGAEDAVLPSDSIEQAEQLLGGNDIDVVLLPGADPGALLHLAALARERAPRAACLVVRERSSDGAPAPEQAGLDGVLAAGEPSAAALVERLRRAVAERALRLAEERTQRLCSALATAQETLGRLAILDPLTEVLNRRGLENALERELEEARRSGSGVAACMVDCVRFKRVNEALGHAVGDIAMRRVVQRMAGALRKTDILGRLAGDKFLILLPHTRLAEAVLVAERVRLAVAATPVIVSPEPVTVELNVGTTALPWEASNLDEILPLVRIALAEQAGAFGRAGEGGEDDRDLARLLRQLVSGSGLRAVGQPIVRLSDERTVGYELLSRGREGLFEAPVQFLRLARDQGILTAVDLQCLKICLRLAATLPAGMQVHVNIFPSTLLDVSVDELLRLLGGCKHADLCLELSEEQFVGDPRELLDRLAALRKAGIRLGIDDVGRGRGTLDSVILLEPEIVKIDRELINGISCDVRKERLLRRLLALTAVLGCEIIAEGVEVAEDAAVLRELGVERAQGYLWSKPIRLGEVAPAAADTEP